jgi:flagellar biosynthesis protein FlhB
MDQARTEAPTAARVARARRLGVFRTSPELSAGVLLLALAWLGHEVARDAPARIEAAARMLFEPALVAVRDGTAPLSVLRASAELGAAVLAALLAPLLLAAVIAGIAQGGLRLRWPERPQSRGRTPLSDRLGDLGIAACGTVAIVVIGAFALADAPRGLLDLVRRDPAAALAALGATVTRLLTIAGICLVAVGAGALLLRRLRVLRALRTSRSELLRELRDSHGDPRVRAERRRAQAHAASGSAASRRPS